MRSRKVLIDYLCAGIRGITMCISYRGVCCAVYLSQADHDGRNSAQMILRTPAAFLKRGMNRLKMQPFRRTAVF